MQKEFQILSDIIKKGGVGVFPTDTIYGLVGSALNNKTVERIYNIRKRNKSKPMIVLISSRNDLKKFQIKTNLYQKKSLAKVWPGKVSVVLPCKGKKLVYLHRNSGGIAFRVPKDKKLLEFLQKTGPLVAPSANLEGKKPSQNLKQAKLAFKKTVDFYFCPKKLNRKPSKLIRLNKDSFQILR